MHARITVYLLLLFAGLAAGTASAQPAQPLTVDEAVRLGLEEDEAVQAVRAEAAAESAAFRQARSARYPTVSSQASYSRLSDNIPEIAFDTDFLPGLDTSFTLAPVALNRYYSELSLEQPLFTGFRLHNQIEAARYRADAALHEADREEADAAYRIRRAYWQLYRSIATLEATDEAMAHVEAHLEDVENRRNAGAALDSDVLTVRTRLSEVRLERIEAQNAVRLARLDLNRMVGYPLDASVDLAAEIDIETPVQGLNSLIDQAIASRPTLRALTARALASEAEVDAERGSWFPEVALNGRYMYARPNQYFFTDQNTFKGTWEAGVAIRWNLWDGGARAASASGARARLSSAEARLTAAREDVAVDVTRHYLELQRSVEVITVSNQHAMEAEEVLRMRQQQYALGAALSTDVLDAEQALRAAQARRVRARADYAVARAALRNAVGHVW